MSLDKSVNLKKGVSFEFEDSGNKITFRSSPFSGLEEVLVNGELVTSKKSYSKISTLEFPIGDDTYAIVIELVSMIKGPIICTLMKNGAVQKKKQIVFKLPDTKFSKKLYAFCALLGAFFVFIQVYFELPLKSYYFFLGTTAVYFSVYFYFKQNDPEFFMEELDN